jgi:hypothetical protein
LILKKPIIVLALPQRCEWRASLLSEDSSLIQIDVIADSARNQPLRRTLTLIGDLLHFYCTASQIVDYQWSG